MQDKHISTHKEEQILSLRSQRLVEHIENQWLESQMSLSETLKNIMISLPDPYKDLGLNTIAECLVNDMKLHFLNIIAKFYQDAEKDGIDIEEQEDTLADTLAEANELIELSKRISVHSLDELLKISSITSGIYKLSKPNNAYDAQRWMYKLHTLYENKLQQESLLARKLEPTFSFSMPISADAWGALAQLANEALTNITEEAQVQESESNSNNDNNHWNKFLSQSPASNTYITNATLPTIAG